MHINYPYICPCVLDHTHSNGVYSVYSVCVINIVVSIVYLLYNSRSYGCGLWWAGLIYWLWAGHVIMVQSPVKSAGNIPMTGMQCVDGAVKMQS